MEGGPGYHVEVLAEEVIAFLEPKPGGCHLELGVSTGGHFLRICRMLGPGGFALGVDLDGTAIALAVKRLAEAGIECRVELVKGDYGQLRRLLHEKGIFPGTFATCLLDAGISGFQLKGGRGFSYLTDEFLDMRYDSESGSTAAELLSHCERDELARVFTELGDLKEGAKVADAVTQARIAAPIQTSFQLVNAVSGIWPEKMPQGKRMRKLGQLFMAIRETVNPGNKSLTEGAAAAAHFLRDKGRLAVLTFSGDENLAIKAAVHGLRRPGPQNPDWILKQISGGAVRPSRREVIANPAAHSAMLRVFEKRCGEGKKE